MAVIDLKNEKKIIIIQNDIQYEEKVLTLNNNEPIFRQNGYEPNGDKSSFALAFDSANNENIILPNQLTGTTNLSDLTVEVTFESTGAAGNNEWLFRAGATNRDGVIIQRRIAGNYQVVTYANGSNNNIHVFSLPVGANTIRIENLEVFVNGSLIHTLTEGSLSDLGSVAPYFFGAQGAYSNSIGYGFSLQGVNYPLTEGLGNTTNGVNINTSHADGIKRINFGMWLKGNDIDGWTPYTIV